MAKNYLLLNTLESRELKREGIITIERLGQKITLSYDKKLEDPAVVVNVERVALPYCDPFAFDYVVRLTQEESKELKQNGVVIVKRANATYEVNQNGCFTLAEYTDIVVR